MARYTIGKLYRPPETEKLEASSENGHLQESYGTIGGLEAVNFITVATPHLGSRGNKQVSRHPFPVRAFESNLFLNVSGNLCIIFRIW